MANKYLDLAGLQAYNGALLGTQIGSLVTYDSDNSRFVKTTFTYDSATGIVTKTTANTIATNGSVASGNTALVTGDAVYQAIQGITEPMIFKGAVSALPTGSTASPIKVGYTYKLTAAITDIPVASSETDDAKAGDTIICSTADSSTGTATYWAIIPSGDEPTGTVTDITIAGKTEAITNSGQSSEGVITLTVNAATNPQSGNPTFGVVAVGDNITNTNGTISVATATDGTLGLVKPDGTTLKVNASGGALEVQPTTDSAIGGVTVATNSVISNSGGAIDVKIDGTTVTKNASNQLTVPVATDSTLGAVKIGDNITITNGVITATAATYDTESTPISGTVIVDADTLTLSSGIVGINTIDPATDINALFA